MLFCLKIWRFRRRFEVVTICSILLPLPFSFCQTREMAGFLSMGSSGYESLNLGLSRDMKMLCAPFNMLPISCFQQSIQRFQAVFVYVASNLL